MKATITKLWDTSVQIVVKDDNDQNSFDSISEIARCENVLIEKKVKGIPCRSILIDDTFYDLSTRTVKHPCGGKITIFEIM